MQQEPGQAADPITKAIYATALTARACRDQLRSQPQLLRLYRFILEAFAATGQPPGAGDLATAAGELLPLAPALAKLCELDLVVTRDGDPPIRVAYPFSADPTPHRVTFAGGPAAYAVCALDALGMPLMLRRDAFIASSEPVTGKLIQVRIEGDQATWEPPTGVLFIAPAQGCGPAADCACRSMNFFTTRSAAADWAGEHEQDGWILSQQQALTRARLVFADVLHELPAPPGGGLP